jgi:hypothetical protein
MNQRLTEREAREIFLLFHLRNLLTKQAIGELYEHSEGGVKHILAGTNWADLDRSVWTLEQYRDALFGYAK